MTPNIGLNNNWNEMDTPFYGVNALKTVVLPRLFTKGVSTMKLQQLVSI